MSVVTKCCVGTLPFPCNRYMNSTRMGRICLPQAWQRGGRVGFTICTTLQNLHYRLSISTVCYSSNIVSVSPKFSPSSVAILPVRCSGEAGREPASDTAGTGLKSDSQNRGLFQVAALIGSATIASKLLGLVRETVLAAVFGVGPVVNAFSYASVIPSFFLILLGGINGPFHLATAATLSKQPKGESRLLMQKLSIVNVVVFGTISIAIFLFAGHLVDLIAPGLMVPGCIDGLLTRKLATLQLKAMAPCTMLASLIGVGFGALSTAGVYGIPSLSPAVSSISILVSVSVYVLSRQKFHNSLLDVTAAALSLAAGTTIGALAQWALQVVAQYRAELGSLKGSIELWSNPFLDKGVHEVFAVLLPAAISSGMLQLATYTDLYFASFIPGAAAGLGYANLLAMAPLGILSSSILVPLLPMFSRLSKVVTLLMTALVVSLARPIVRIIFERHAFDAGASLLVSSLLVYYVLGSTFYLARDLLVHVFYALGDGRVPLKISTAAICANVVLDWLLVQYAGYGVQGLVMATSLVNCASAVALLVRLSSRLEGLQLRHWVRPLVLVGFSATIAGIFTKYSYDQLSLLLFTVGASKPRYLWAADPISVTLASGVGVTSYFMSIFLFRVPEMKSVLKLLQAKL